MPGRAVDLLMFSSYLFFIFSGLLALFLIILPSRNRICTLYTVEGAKWFSIVKMSSTDRNSLVSI